jgi:hypothetical protein
VGWPCPYRTTIDSSMSTAYDAGNNDNVTLCPMVAHVEWSNNLTVMSKLAFVVLGHRQRYNFQEPLASAKVSTRTLPFAGRAVYLRKERVGGSFRSAYLRVTPVLGHWGVYLLGCGLGTRLTAMVLVGCRLELTRAVWPAEQSLTTGSLRQNTPIKKKNLTE